MEKNTILEKLADGVLNMDEEETIASAELAIEKGVDAAEAINHGLIKGMNEAGKLFEEHEYFVPELLLCSDAMYAGLDILTPQLPKDNSNEKWKAVIGVVEGDTHDIGKNLVKVMLEASGFETYDLGRNVPARDFVAKAQEINADLICLSTLMTTTMPVMGDVVNLLREKGLKDKIKVLVGGGPISQAFAQEIGADGYGENAANAVRVAKAILGQCQTGAA